ncbi:hypothetical protein D7B12_18115 [Salmonella enterica]|nr:hypothetical protein [Salmonella enterica]
MSLLTAEASQAIEWMRQRMPDGIFNTFQSELEQALMPVMSKFGLDHELADAFNVTKLVADREPLMFENDGVITLTADIYNGNGTYAVTRDGVVYSRNQQNKWHKSRLSINEVRARSITKVSGSITLKDIK